MAPSSNEAATPRSAAVPGAAADLAEEITRPPPVAVTGKRRTTLRQLVTGTWRPHLGPRHTMIVPDHRDVRVP